MQSQVNQKSVAGRNDSSVEGQLKFEEDHYRFLADHVKDVLWILDPSLRFTYTSPSVMSMTGYSDHEFVHKSLHEFLPPASNEIVSELLQQTLDQNGYVKQGSPRNIPIQFELRRKDGTLFWGEIHVTLICDDQDKLVKILGVTRDITDRKQAENKVRAYQKQLRTLTLRLSLTEQQERRRIATDLHDSIGQMLAVSKIKLGQALSTLDNSKASTPISEALSLIDQAIQHTRSMTFQLSLPLLYESGLEAAVDWLLSEISRNHALTTHFHHEGPSCSLPEDVRVVLFQAVRELLTNVVKHAQARNVSVSIFRKTSEIQIEIVDDGIGFNAAEVLANTHTKHAFGLFHLRERLDYLCGSFDLQSEPGKGTKTILTIPLKNK